MVLPSYYWTVVGTGIVVGGAMMAGSSIFAAVHNFRSRRKGSAIGFALLGFTFTCILMIPLYAVIRGRLG